LTSTSNGTLTISLPLPLPTFMKIDKNRNLNDLIIKK
jgi:hypothetical protein